MNYIRWAWPLAAALFFLACTEETSSHHAHLKLGQKQLEDGDVDQAIASIRLALHQDSLYADAWAQLARAQALNGNWAARDKYLRRAMNITYERGLKALESGDEEAAINSFGHTLKISPSHPLALNQLGDIYLGRKQWDKALHYYERSALANPNFPVTFLKLGELHAFKDSTEKAIQAFERVIELDINAVEAYLSLGKLYLEEKDWAAAAERFRTALLIQPASFEARTGLAQASGNL